MLSILGGKDSSKALVLTEYQCFMCGRTFATRQGLLGHLKAHKGSYREVTFLAPLDLYDRFKSICKAHGLTTCHMLNTFMAMCVEAFRRGAVLTVDARTHEMRMEGGSNPMVFNINQYFGSRPRGHNKYAFASALEPAVGSSSKCGFCSDAPRYVGVQDGVEIYLCRFHYAFVKNMLQTVKELR
jgi:hypothetical protein